MVVVKENLPQDTIRMQAGRKATVYEWVKQLLRQADTIVTGGKDHQVINIYLQ